MDVVHFDFKNAFESIPHQRLPLKVKSGLFAGLYHYIPN